MVRDWLSAKAATVGAPLDTHHVAAHRNGRPGAHAHTAEFTPVAERARSWMAAIKRAGLQRTRETGEE